MSTKEEDWIGRMNRGRQERLRRPRQAGPVALINLNSALRGSRPALLAHPRASQHGGGRSGSTDCADTKISGGRVQRRPRRPQRQLHQQRRLWQQRQRTPSPPCPALPPARHRSAAQRAGGQRGWCCPRRTRRGCGTCPALQPGERQGRQRMGWCSGFMLQGPSICQQQHWRPQ